MTNGSHKPQSYVVDRRKEVDHPHMVPVGALGAGLTRTSRIREDTKTHTNYL